MNTCTFIGRLVKDPEIKTIGEAKVANFTIAVNKRFKSKSEDAPTADFIPVSVWRSSAEFAEKYFHKGKKVFVVGNLETYSYEHAIIGTREENPVMSRVSELVSFSFS